VNRFIHGIAHGFGGRGRGRQDKAHQPILHPPVVAGEFIQEQQRLVEAFGQSRTGPGHRPGKPLAVGMNEPDHIGIRPRVCSGVFHQQAVGHGLGHQPNRRGFAAARRANHQRNPARSQNGLDTGSNVFHGGLNRLGDAVPPVHFGRGADGVNSRDFNAVDVQSIGNGHQLGQRQDMLTGHLGAGALPACFPVHAGAGNLQFPAHNMDGCQVAAAGAARYGDRPGHGIRSFSFGNSLAQVCAVLLEDILTAVQAARVDCKFDARNGNRDGPQDIEKRRCRHSASL